MNLPKTTTFIELMKSSEKKHPIDEPLLDSEARRFAASWLKANTVCGAVKELKSKEVVK